MPARTSRSATCRIHRDLEIGGRGPLHGKCTDLDGTPDCTAGGSAVDLGSRRRRVRVHHVDRLPQGTESADHPATRTRRPTRRPGCISGLGLGRWMGRATSPRPCWTVDTASCACDALTVNGCWWRSTPRIPARRAGLRRHHQQSVDAITFSPIHGGRLGPGARRFRGAVVRPIDHPGIPTG